MNADDCEIEYESVEETPPAFRVIAEANDYWTDHLVTAALRLMNNEILYKWEDFTDHDVEAEHVEFFYDNDARAYGMRVNPDRKNADKVAQMLPMTITRNPGIFEMEEIEKPFSVEGGLSERIRGMIYVLSESGCDESEIADIIPSIGGWDRQRTTR